MKKCKSDIREHCVENLKTGDPQLIVECLIRRKHKLLKRCVISVSNKPIKSFLTRSLCSCRSIVAEREKEMFSDIDLNVDLKTSCEGDIQRFCRNATKVAKAAHDRNEDPNGIVYACLTDVFISRSKSKVP